MSANENAESSLDDVLTEVGDFGPFQLYTFFLLCLINFLSAFSVVNYMISADTLDYRCKVPECDIGANNRDIQYEQPWLKDAIPSSNNKYDSCLRYAPKTGGFDSLNGQCSADLFDKTKTIACSEFIYASDEKNVQTEFNIHCSESYKLALIGTAGNVARFIFLPISGLLADRFGRLPGILIGSMLCSLFALMKSFANGYYMYIAFEFLEASAGSCVLTAINVLAIELMTPKYRVLSNTILSIAYPVGEMLVGLVAMYVHDYRMLIRITYTPGLLAFVCFWLLPESVRWLLITGRIGRAIKTLKRMAKLNRKELSPKSILQLQMSYARYSTTRMTSSEDEEKSKSPSVFKSLAMVSKSRILGLRFLNCCYQWAACIFCYYGLSMFSTHIPGADRYLSFIIVMASELPGVLLAQPLLNRIKRRVLMFSSFFLSAALIIASPFIPKEYPMVVLFFFVVGKASITCAFTALYVYTAEQWPTSIRSTIQNSCSMIGRTGSMVAPLVVVLGVNSSFLPTLLFGGAAVLAAILALFSPETFSKKLPDTIDEAEKL